MSIFQLIQFVSLVNTTLINVLVSDGLTLDVFLKSLSERRYTQDYRDQIRDMVSFYFSAFNSDGDDLTLTPRELSQAYEACNIPIKEVVPGFLDKDHNRNGIVEWSESYGNAVKYFIDAPLNDTSNSWAGPVMACNDVVNGDQSKLPQP